MATWHRVLEALNIKGGPLMGLWSCVMVYKLIAGAEVSAVHRDIYLGALAIYGVSKGHALRVEKQVEVKRIQEAGDV